MLSTTIALLALAAAPADTSAASLLQTIHAPTPAAWHATARDTTRARYERAEALVLAGRYQAARDAFRAIARGQAQGGTSPSATMRRIADTYFFAGDLRRTAAALEEAVDSAASFGEVRLQAETLVDLLTVQCQLGDAAAVEVTRTRATRLLASPHLPVEVATVLRARMNER